MIVYRCEGRIPSKPHTVLKKENGSLYYEQCFTRTGFDGPFSILYHETQPQEYGQSEACAPLWTRDDANQAPPPLKRSHLESSALSPRGSSSTGRHPLLFNSDLTIGIIRPVEDDSHYFANGDGDDLIYIHRGGGEVHSWFGQLTFKQGDYVVIPRAIPHRITLNNETQHWLWAECRSDLRIPSQYKNPTGQLRMDAPYTPRDFRYPELTTKTAAHSPSTVITKRSDNFTQHCTNHPIIDTVGWDGTVYPFAFPILNFSPKIGQVHLPPTVHGTFATAKTLFCSFVPRMVDFGEGAIPCPYPHSNVDVDEVIFYCDGDFTSRRDLAEGSMSLHPSGMPHGPHPGAYEASIGTQKTRELAVMIDTFEPLRPTSWALEIEDPNYNNTWNPTAED